jgi:hypothetical protein
MGCSAMGQYQIELAVGDNDKDITIQNEQFLTRLQLKKKFLQRKLLKKDGLKYNELYKQHRQEILCCYVCLFIRIFQTHQYYLVRSPITNLRYYRRMV